MSEKTRYSELLYHVMPDNLRNEFFSGTPGENIDAGWDLFETLHPDTANKLFEVLEPLLEGIKVDLKFKRDHDALLASGDELGAARLSIYHKASKLNW